MDRMVGVCGIICSDCDAYKATQANDMDWVGQIIEKWKAEYNIAELTAEGVMCDGCTTEGRKCGHCAECELRRCALEKGLANCGLCAAYESCEHILGFFKFAPQAKPVLDKIHAEL